MDNRNRIGTGRTLARASRHLRHDLSLEERNRLATAAAASRYAAFLHDELRQLPDRHPLRDEYHAQLTDLARRLA